MKARLNQTRLASAASLRMIFTALAMCLACQAGNTAGGQKDGSQAGGQSQGQTPSQGSQEASSSGGGNQPFEEVVQEVTALDQLVGGLRDDLCNRLSSAPASASDAIQRVVILDQASLQALAGYETFEQSALALTQGYVDAATQRAAQAPAQPPSSPPDGGGLHPRLAAVGGSAGAATPTWLTIVSALMISARTDASASGTLQDTSAALRLLHQFDSHTVFPASSCKSRSANTPPQSVSEQALGMRYAYPDIDISSAGSQRIVKLLAGLNQSHGMFMAAIKNDTSSESDNEKGLDAAYSQLSQILLPNISSNSSQQSSSPSIVQGAAVASAIDGDDLLSNERTAAVVYIQVGASGGTERDTKNVFTMLFTGDFISYSGGVLLNYAIYFPVAGKYVLQSANAETKRTPLSSQGNIN